MKIAMIGTGYVGLVTGACFANSGNQVECVDIDQKKVQALRAGHVPIYEPGLTEIVQRNTAEGRLTFTTDLAAAVSKSDIVYVAVGTPPSGDGSANLSALWGVVDNMAGSLKPQAVVVIKSTVPVGTNAKAYHRLKELTKRECRVVSNPEFLKEGAAINDFSLPDRVVVGARSAADADVLKALYDPFLRTDKPFLVMSPESAELTKYVANALLSTKISFINEMANLCERMGGDINDVRRGIGHDQRIGFAFLFPGVGYGGSCFPKDVRALSSMARSLGLEPRILDAVDQVNHAQKSVLIHKIQKHFGPQLKGKTIAIWGLAFKPRTDDIREAPAIVLINQLLQHGCTIHVHDPEAMANVKSEFGDRLMYSDEPMKTLDGADALAINTEWTVFRTPDFDEIKTRMKQPLIFDGRNLYEPSRMAAQGFTYYSIGRRPVGPQARDDA